MHIKPLYPYPALLIDNDERYVVISDLHIGFEEQYRKKGIAIDDNYIYEMLRELEEIYKNVKPSRFILLGDIKDSIGKISKSEWRLVPEFLEQLKSISDVIIIPGNHDSNIATLVPQDIRITTHQGLIIDDILLMHGHTIPKHTTKRVVMGHLHPRIVKEGSLLNGERVWIFTKGIFESHTIDVIIMPSFNRYLTSTSRHDNTIAPLLKRVEDKILDCLIITLDGSIVGDKSMLKYLI